MSTGTPARTPIVFVPGVSGSVLEDPATGRTVWGGSLPLLRPRDGGYSLALPLIPNPSRQHPQAAYKATGPVRTIRLLFWKKKVYQPFIQFFEGAGYRLGGLTAPEADQDLFFFDYDWRRNNFDSATALGRQLEDLAASRPTKRTGVDLVCQSNAAKICRYLAKYGTLSPTDADAGLTPPETGFAIRKIILIGASNGGSLRTLALLNRGRRYIPVIGRKLSQETTFSIRPLFEDLPSSRTGLFFDTDGQPIEVDLLDPQSWLRYGWSIFGRKPTRRLERGRASDIFATQAERLHYLEDQLRRARLALSLLERDTPHAADVRYYRLENQSSETAAAALLRKTKRGWQTLFFMDRPVKRNPRLRALAVAVGDGHATLASQRDLSAGEEAALAGAAMIAGGHFEMLIKPEGLGAILTFLSE